MLPPKKSAQKSETYRHSPAAGICAGDKLLLTAKAVGLRYAARRVEEWNIADWFGPGCLGQPVLGRDARAFFAKWQLVGFYMNISMPMRKTNSYHRSH